jgi:hypothetical protein
VIWDISPKLALSSAVDQDGTPIRLTITGYNFGTNPSVASVQLTSERPHLPTFDVSSTCVIYVDIHTCQYTNTSMCCNLPPGEGVRYVNLTVNGRKMRQLPRFPDDLYFWAWSESSTTNNPNCVQTPNPISPEPSHTWGDNWVCSGSDNASLLMMWSLSGPISGQQCVNVWCEAESARWKNKMYLCIHPQAPYTIGWSQIGPLPQYNGCISFREGSDPYWDDGLKQLCGSTSSTLQSSDGLWLYRYSAPIIVMIVPNHGPTIGGSIITVNGLSFGITPGSLMIGDRPCSIVVTAYNHTSFQCITPSGEGQTNQVTLFVAGQASLGPINFHYDLPVVTSMNPTSGPTSGLISLTLHGANFGATHGMVAVGQYNCRITNWYDTTIACTLSPGAGTNLFVTITTFDNTMAIQDDQIYFNFTRPHIVEVEPKMLLTQGGDIVTVFGTSFSTMGTVRIGSSLCVPLSWNHSRITCYAPPGSSSNVGLTVITSSDQFNEVPFPLGYSPPVITNMIPVCVSVSGIAVTNVYLTLIGESFGSQFSDRRVTVNGLQCTSLTGHSHTHLLCALPLTIGYHIPVVVHVDGQDSNAWNFTYAPLINLISFTNALTHGGSIITIDGTSFSGEASTTSIMIGGFDCPIITTTTTTIFCTLPIGQGMNNTVHLTIDHLISPSSSTLSYDAPQLLMVSPRFGEPHGGDVITISGINFGIKGDQTSVTIDDLKCNIKWSNHTIIYCIIPPHQTGNAIIKVTTSAQSVNEPLTFTYVEACPINTTRISNDDISSITSCGCIAGYTNVIPTDSTSTCIACPAMTSKPVAGGGSCLHCDDGKTSLSGSAQCHCDRGRYTINQQLQDNQCIVCPPDTYQPLTNQSICVACPQGSMTNGSSGGTSVLQCTCGFGHYSPSGHAPCVPCYPGSYNDVIGVTQCTPCATGTFESSAGSSSCSGHCSSNSTSPTGSSSHDQCFCKPGYTINMAMSMGVGMRVNETCSACATGRYKSSTDDDHCVECPIDTYANAPASIRCTSCPPWSSTMGLAGQANVLACQCKCVTLPWIVTFPDWSS